MWVFRPDIVCLVREIGGGWGIEWAVEPVDCGWGVEGW